MSWFLNEKEAQKVETVLNLVKSYISKRDTKQANRKRQAEMMLAAKNKPNKKPRLGAGIGFQYPRRGRGRGWGGARGRSRGRGRGRGRGSWNSHG